MLASPTMIRNPPSPPSHPRRPSAYLSVGLRHESPAISENTGKVRAVEDQQDKYISAKESPIRKSSGQSNNSGDSAGSNAQKWFDRSNKQPGGRLGQAFEDNEPPYFLHRHSSDTSNAVSESSRVVFPTGLNPGPNRVSGIMRAATNGSSADDYRSVIDDLTIENQMLRERLRKYETSYGTHLEKDKLFEVKIHGLPACKKRELEDTLRAFASSIDDSPDDGSLRIRPRDTSHPYSSFEYTSKNLSSSSTSNPRPVDSAYASMSASGPTSTSTLNHAGLESVVDTQPQKTKEQKVQSFLLDIPEGLLPRHSPVMTEKMKKKMVVRRLEQIFAGKANGIIGDHSQPLQQQEVSQSAARADRLTDGQLLFAEGIREAHILPHEVEVGQSKPGKLVEKASHPSPSKALSELAHGSTPITTSLEQRPTRPLDLDPDRAQNPSENLEYIRHLGLSTPQLITEGSTDVAADTEGWIYLNLLINMAQLHTINVTPDFVRSAVAEVSANFQLSPDGRKIQWRGGTESTRLSSDSGASSTRSASPHDSDSFDETSRKRRKINADTSHNIGQDQFASVPIDVRNPDLSADTSGPSNAFHYKPLFHHQPSLGTSFDDIDSQMSYTPGDDSGTGRVSQSPHIWGQRSRSRSSSRRRRGDGTIVFYSGAQFCTDLSSDRGNILTPLHVTSVDKDGYSNHTQDALGCKRRKSSASSFSRTLSGSVLPFRPFKDYSKGPGSLQIRETRAKTPELATDAPTDLNFSLEWSSDDTPGTVPFLDLSACGLGGTQPADHFAMRVETRRMKLDSHTQAKLSKFSAPGPKSRKFLHSISKSSLDSFRTPEHQHSADSITSRVAAVTAPSSPMLQSRLPVDELPVTTEVISTRFRNLEPSALPAPTAYYAALSSSDDDSYFSTSSVSGIDHLGQGRSYMQRPFSTLSDEGLADAPHEVRDFADRDRDRDRDMEVSDGDEDEDEDDGEEEENHSSIDMLAQARETDPEKTAAKEREFKRETELRILEDVPDGSSARYSGWGK